MKERGTYLALRVAVAIFGALPEPVIRRLGRAAGRIWHRVDPRRRRMVEHHMRRLDQPASGAVEVFASYGRYWAESFWARPRRIPRFKETLTIDGLDNLRRAMDGGRGVIVVLPHLGNWEAAALIAHYLDLDVVAVAERLANPHITEWFTEQRAMFGIEIVLTGDGGVTARLAERLRQQAAVCLLSDRDLTGRGLEVDFFGERTTLPGGPAVLARRTGAPLVPAAVYFKPGAGHHGIIGSPIEIPADADAQETTQKIARQLEELIRRDPTQWHLVQPNWPSDRA
ncbi:MAG TPA: phosphatidylinositol mannoside acyltransferase [Acidimicrobiia bacterium]|nr:phosphatidylinositol mannoside acyltransferase [Acidimicrobiia bacterium]